MKKTSTEKKQLIAKYTAVAGAFLASGAVNSQVTYVDINPDAVIDKNTSPFSLDLNTDAVMDFDFAVGSVASSGTYYGVSYSVTGSYAGVTGAGSNGVLMNGSTSYPMPVAAGNVIGSAGNFGTGNQTLGFIGAVTVPSLPQYNQNLAYGSFLGLSDQYLGVKFTAGANTHYGWIRLDVDTTLADLTVRLKDYAYNTVPMDSIAAGQMVGLENIAIDNKVTIKTHLDEAFINVTPDLIGGTIAITDMNGRDVKSTPIADINTKVTYSGIDSGIYMIVARFNTGIVSKKIYVR